MILNIGDEVDSLEGLKVAAEGTWLANCEVATLLTSLPP